MTRVQIFTVPSLMLLAAVVVGATAQPALAQNLLPNADFDSGLGLSDWQNAVGSAVVGPDSGSCVLSGAVDGESAASGGGSQFFHMISDCLALDGSAHPVAHLGGMYKTTANVWARLYLSQYDAADCNSAATFTSQIFGGTSAAWTRLSGPVALSANTVAVRFEADFNPAVAGIPQFLASWDRFYLGITPEIFVDDFEFESGSACHWSSILD